jgi:hypothetical protein
MRVVVDGEAGGELVGDFLQEGQCGLEQRALQVARAGGAESGRAWIGSPVCTRLSWSARSAAEA